MPVSTQEVKKNGIKDIEWRNYTSAIGLIILLIVSGFLTDNFFTVLNIVNVLKQIVVPTCLAIGMTYVILLGGIDLSVGSVIALFGTVIGLLLQQFNWVAAVIICFLIGSVLGMLNGTLITKFSVPPFIVTLAGYTAYKGLALYITGASAVKISNPTFLAISSKQIPVPATIAIFIAIIVLTLILEVMNIKKSNEKSGAREIAVTSAKVIALAAACFIFVKYGGIPISVTIAAALFAAFSFVLGKTVFGAEVYAIGGNKAAAKLAGIRVDRRTITVYTISFVCAVLGALLTASRLGSGAPQSGILAEMDAIAAVVIGGTSMNGGVGKLSGTILGVLLIGFLNNLLSLMGASAYTQQILKGLIILGAVMLDMQLSKKEKS